MTVGYSLRLTSDMCSWNICLQAGETSLHVAVRHCHFNVADKILRFLSKKQSRYDLVMLVNEQNEVSSQN